MNYLYPCKPNRIYPNSAFFNRLDNDPAWIAEVKKNGWRCLAAKNNTLTLWTRHHTTIKDRLPELRAILDRLPPGTVLDGELLQNRTKQVKGVYYIFDILEHRGERVTHLPLKDRRVLLERTISDLVGVAAFKSGIENRDLLSISLAQQTRIGKKKLFYDSIEGEANEGIVIKKLNSVYMASDSGCLQHPFWLKVKKVDAHVRTH
jgi:DNA ligase 1